MDLGNSKYPLETDAYTDLAALNKLKTSAVKNDPGAIKEVAKQFESIFLNMMLKSMRAANESFAENDIFNSKESRFYQEMLDQQYSLSMSKSQGIGLAKIIEKQLQGLATVRNPLAPDAEVSIESVDKPNTNDGFDFDKRLLARSGQKTASDINAAESYFGDKQVLASDHKSRPANAHANATVSSDQPDAVGSDNNDKLVSLNEDFQSPSEFVSGLWQIAQSAAKLLSADPKILIAQAALERRSATLLAAKGSKGPLPSSRTCKLFSTRLTTGDNNPHLFKYSSLRCWSACVALTLISQPLAIASSTVAPADPIYVLLLPNSAGISAFLTIFKLSCVVANASTIPSTSI